jgi:glycosyltransferase involved in cell wall biosynthesis
VIHIHGGGFKEYYEKNSRFVHKNLLKCDTIIALTQYWKEYFNSLGFENVFIVPNIVESPVTKEKKNNDGKVHFLYLGLITKAKGIYDLLDVINKHKAEFDGKIILHIGGNGETTPLQNIIKEHNLSNIVQFEGWVSGEKKVELLNNANVFILPSYTEGLPISILEAMSYSLPVITTQVGGIPEVVKDGENGLLFTPSDKDALYKAIDKLAINKGLQEDMGKKSYDLVQPHFPGNVAVKLESIYNELLKQ